MNRTGWSKSGGEKRKSACTEERYEKQAKEKIDDLKREERRVKKMEEERLKKERDLYEREKKLQDLKQNERRGSPKRSRSPHLHRRQKSFSPKHNRDASKVSPRPQRSGGSSPVVTVSLSSSTVRRKSLKTADRKVSNGVISASTLLSPTRSPRRRSFRPRPRSPSDSANQSVLNRLGPKIPVRARLGLRKRLGTLKPVLSVSSRDDEDEDFINNNSGDREVFTTVDQVGYTEGAKEIEVKQIEKVPVDLDKIVIKRRVKKEKK